MEDFEESSLKIFIERYSRKYTCTLTPYDDIRTMRHVIGSEILPSLLNELLNTKKKHIQSMKSKPITNTKLEELCRNTDQLSTLDITSLCFFLFELFKINPTSGFKHMPNNQATKEGDDILRLRMYRNMVCHDEVKNTSIVWEETCSAIIRLAGGKIKFRDHIKQIETECIDFSMKEKYRAVVKLWKEEEDDLKAWTKNLIDQQKEEVREIIDRHIANSTATINNAIKEYKEQTEKKLESLMQKYGEQLKTCMSKREGISGSFGVQIEDILQNLQREMKDYFLDNVKKMTEDIEDKVARNLKEGMNNLRDIISRKNETFFNSIQDSITNLSAEMKHSQNEVVERNEEMVKKYLQKFEQIKTAIEEKEENSEVVTEKIVKSFQEFEQKMSALASDSKKKGISDSECDDSSDETQEPVNKIKVKWLQRKVTKTKLKAFFRSKKKSGGGEIEYVEFNKDRVYAIIAFRNPKVVGRVLKKQPFVLEGDRVHVEEYTSEDDTDNSDDDLVNEDRDCILEVRCMKENTTSDKIKAYFESRMAAGVLNVLRCEIKGDIMITHISSTSRKDMMNVLGQQHRVDEIQLEVREYIPPKMYESKLIIKGIHSSTKRNSLSDFLHTNGITSSIEFLYGEKEDIVMVSLEETPDFQRLEANCKNTKVDGCSIQIVRVPVSHCITVESCPSVEEPNVLEDYFRSKKLSVGVEIQQIEHISEKEIFLVHFTDHTVAEKVCLEKHSIGDQTLSVSLYYEQLGIVYSGECPRLKLPETIVTQNIDARKMQFLLSSKASLETFLSNSFAKVIWPEDVKGDLEIECVLTKEVEGCQEIAKTWNADTTTRLESFLDILCTRSIPVTHNVWNEMAEILRKKYTPNPDGTLIVFEKTPLEIFIIGQSKCVFTLTEEIRADLNHVESKTNRVQEYINGKHCKLQLLVEQNFTENMQKNYRGLTVKIDLSQCQVMFQGIASVVSKAKKETSDTMERIMCVQISSDKKVELLQYPAVKDYVMGKMRDNNLRPALIMDGGLLKVYAMDDEANKISELLDQLIVESHITVIKDSQYLLSSSLLSDQITQIRESLKHNIEVVFSPNDGLITTYSTNVDTHRLSDLIQAFVEKNKLIQCTLVRKVGAIKILKQLERQGHMQTISKSMSPHQVKIEIREKCVVIEGTDATLRKAEQQINDLTQSFIKRHHVLIKHGVTKFMTSQKGADKLSEVEEMKNVVIISAEADDGLNQDDELGSPEKLITVREMSSCNTGRCIIKVMLCDITDIEADVLVNAVNTNLKFDEGLAKSIVDKGGPSILQECEDYVRQAGTLEEGDVFCTSSGTLKCKMIAHAVCKRWNGGQDDEENLISKTVFTCMRQVDENNCKSIAFPAFGTGSFGVPVEVSARATIGTVTEYCEKMTESLITEIYLCDAHHDVVKALNKTLKRQCGDDKVIETGASGRSDPDQDVFDVSDSDELPVVDNIEVVLVNGDIAEQSVDVIVNTTSTDLQLDGGPVSKSILKAAGKGLQTECTNLYPEGIQYGEVAITGSHSLKCQSVFHGALPQWGDVIKALQILQRFMTKCLEEAAVRNYRTIAFPAMGTGHLGYPKELVAKEMLNIISLFSSSNPESTLKTAYVVVYKDIPTIKAFEDAIKKSQNGTTMDAEPRRKQLQPQESVYIDQVIQDIGNLKLKIYQGDITSVCVDVIVNSTNEDFDLIRGDVAYAIARTGGPKLEDEVSIRKKDMKSKGVVVTSGGDLPCHYVVHLNTEERSWKSHIMMALKEADKIKDINSVAFPALGTGMYHGPSFEDAAKYFFDALIEFQGSVTPANLKDVHVVIFQEDMVQEFVEAVKQCFLTSKGHTGLGFFNKFASFVTGSKEELEWNPQISKIRMKSSSFPLIIYGKDESGINAAIKALEDMLDDDSLTSDIA